MGLQGAPEVHPGGHIWPPQDKQRRGWKQKSNNKEEGMGEKGAPEVKAEGTYGVLRTGK